MKQTIFVLAVLLMFTACNNEPAAETESPATAKDAKEERNKEIVKSTLVALQSLNLDTMLKDLAPDAVDYGDGSMPAVKGADSIKYYIGMWLNSMESFKVDDPVIIADDNRVWVYGISSGKFKSDLMGMPTAGKSYKIPDVDMFVLNDEGKITEHRSIQSSETMLKQMGIEMPK